MSSVIDRSNFSVRNTLLAQCEGKMSRHHDEGERQGHKDIFLKIMRETKNASMMNSVGRHRKDVEENHMEVDNNHHHEDSTFLMESNGRSNVV